ncbi:hypothetical protein E3Q17_01477 [Wallemia mellicola]|uniref:Iron-sulfur assembly protein 1 n=2 Tax=Wallemia mellicola TaxID=1708541 RepID=A0A4T0LSA5_9BASI|nr:hypothetical protein E3Q24_01594 [Wallemia mellicola]TIC02419.1 hypothetical protein E3Q17_01477 [Wallemia mellicola]TIC05966.1 hypothetical protein E3Q16_01531 [Wallemia mellicola]TIC59794.1 hypothetical protein E3Q03_03720 [Wallemia mellicola]
MNRIIKANNPLTMTLRSARCYSRLAQANPGHLNANQPPPPSRMETKQSKPTTEVGWDAPKGHSWHTTPSSQLSSKGKERDTEQSSTASTSKSEPEPSPSKPKSRLRARAAALKLSPAAVEQLRFLSSSTGELLRVGVKNKGCSGMSYHLEYVDKPARFDEVVEQDGVKVLVDSKALFSIIGSTMDWVDDRLSSKFVFNNPNVTETCGCGESMRFG